VISDSGLGIAAGKQPIHALPVWDGGLGIQGTVPLGAVRVRSGCRRHGIPAGMLR
jgi:hypothetical protein